jgi:hypothetical protein
LSQRSRSCHRSCQRSRPRQTALMTALEQCRAMLRLCDVGYDASYCTVYRVDDAPRRPATPRRRAPSRRLSIATRWTWSQDRGGSNIEQVDLTVSVSSQAHLGLWPARELRTLPCCLCRWFHAVPLVVYHGNLRLLQRTEVAAKYPTVELSAMSRFAQLVGSQGMPVLQRCFNHCDSDAIRHDGCHGSIAVRVHSADVSWHGRAAMPLLSLRRSIVTEPA